MCVWALFPKPTTTLGLVEQAFWRVPFFTKWVIASSFEVILARPSRRSTALRLLPLGLRVLDAFSLILLHERTRRKIRLVSFLHVYWYRGGNCNCLLSYTARWTPIANNLQEFFVHAVLIPGFLTTAFLLIISISDSKILISNFLLDTSFHHCFQSVIIRS